MARCRTRAAAAWQGFELSWALSNPRLLGCWADRRNTSRWGARTRVSHVHSPQASTACSLVSRLLGACNSEICRERRDLKASSPRPRSCLREDHHTGTTSKWLTLLWVTVGRWWYCSLDLTGVLVAHGWLPLAYTPWTENIVDRPRLIWQPRKSEEPSNMTCARCLQYAWDKQISVTSK